MQNQTRTISFVSFGNVAIFFSLLLIIAGGVGTYLLGGLNAGIDFESGVSMQVQFSGDDIPDAESVRAALTDFGAVSVQQATNTAGRYFIKSNLGDVGSDAVVTMLQEQLRAEFGEENVEILEVAFIGPRYSGSLLRQSIMLTSSALALILVYIWVRFRLRYAISAIVALIHDVLMTIAFVGVTQIELSTTTIAAILTIIGYSLNDTVVIFDRIRENSDTYRNDVTFTEIANFSIRQSLSRTLITSITTLLAVVAMYVFSTGAIKDFALCMIFGVAVGTYSSICVASTVLVAWAKRFAHRRTRRGRGELTAAKRTGDGQEETKKQVVLSSDKKDIVVNTERIRKELLAQRQRQQQKKKKKKK